MSHTAESKKPLFHIDSIDDFKRILTIAKGGDPDAIQAVANFMDLKSNTERSYFPDKQTAICIGQLNGFGSTYYRNDDWDPYRLVADSLAVALMAFKGFKSNQFVDMTRQTPNLADLQTLGTSERKTGLMDRILGRGKEE